MGLDMHVYSRAEPPPTPTDFERRGGERELHYWRKHYPLHAWMAALYRAKGGRRTDPYGACLVLDRADLHALEALVSEGALPHSIPLFRNGDRESEMRDDLAFVARARAEIDAGRTVFYCGG